MIDQILALVAALLVFAGAVFALGAGLGVLRLPDVYTRMHASTKAGTLGAGLILIAAAIVLPDGAAGWRAVATIAFLILTIAVGSHLIGRAAYRTEVPLWEASVADEWMGRDALAARVAKPTPAVEADPTTSPSTLPGSTRAGSTPAGPTTSVGGPSGSAGAGR